VAGLAYDLAQLTGASGDVTPVNGENAACCLFSKGKV
tara:strand:+ start:1947 stop:2057 length:111 start_codon:yes stop_codon:yes gene_type:complete